VGNFGSQTLHYVEIGGLHSQIFLASTIGLFGSTGLLILHLLGRIGLWRLLIAIFPWLHIGHHKEATAAA
jgi:hypothetical protein